MTPHIKILILNWNGKNLLKPCLDSVTAIDYPNYSIMVIDNGSVDDSVKMVNENFPDVEMVPSARLLYDVIITLQSHSFLLI